MIAQPGVESAARDDQPKIWHEEGGTNWASAATVSMAPLPRMSAWRAIATWNVGRPVDVDAYDQMLEPLSETLNVSTLRGGMR